MKILLGLKKRLRTDHEEQDTSVQLPADLSSNISEGSPWLLVQSRDCNLLHMVSRFSSASLQNTLLRTVQINTRYGVTGLKVAYDNTAYLQSNATVFHKINLDIIYEKWIIAWENLWKQHMLHHTLKDCLLPKLSRNLRVSWMGLWLWMTNW